MGGLKIHAASLGELMQRSNLSRDNANDQPGFAHFDQHDTLARAQCNAADDLHAALAESFAAREFSGKPGGPEKQSDDEQKGEHCLDVGAGRNARIGSVASPRGEGQQQWKC